MVGSLDPEGDDLWRFLPQAVRGYRLCQNDKIEGICNWTVPADDDNPLCASCRITPGDPQSCRPGQPCRVVPPRGRQAASALHVHRARSADGQRDRRAGFRTDVRVSRGCRLAGGPVLTGHAGGVMTVNIAEADDAEREKAANDDARAVSNAPRTHAARDRSLLLGLPHRGDVGARRVPAARPETNAPTTKRRSTRTTSTAPRPIGRHGSSARMRARTRGRIGRDVGALSAHGRHARDCCRVRGSGRSRGAATSRRCRRRRTPYCCSRPRSTA